MPSTPGIGQHHIARDIRCVNRRGSLGGQLSPVAASEAERGCPFLFRHTIPIPVSRETGSQHGRNGANLLNLEVLARNVSSL